ncbi:carbamoyl phosphate synthase small subunit [Candidatus Vidania fulgoroideorum]
MHLKYKQKKAFIVFSNGKIYKGTYYGNNIKNFYGYTVFNTGNFGYEEILTDPSYYNKILILTNSYLGNTGITLLDLESNKVWLKIIIVKNIACLFSNYRNKISIRKFCVKNNINIIYDIDTRGLVKNLKKNKSNIYVYYNKYNHFKNIKYKNLFNISTKFNFLWNKKIKYNTNFYKKILVLDFGIKYNILREISTFFLKIINVNKINNNYLHFKYNGIVLSSGPGNPKYFLFLKKIILSFLKKIFILGICLGHQILSLILKFKIRKMKIGQHGINYPVICINKFLITSQNHDFVVLNNNNIYSLFDNSNQGILKKRIICFQGHPEGAPGPKNTFIFNLFKKSI